MFVLIFIAVNLVINCLTYSFKNTKNDNKTFFPTYNLMRPDY